MRLWLCVLFGMVEALGQSVAGNGLAAGKLLVASRKLGDPNFAQTVIVIVSFDEKGTLGLILNQPTQLPLSRIFSDLKGGKERTDTAYRGGPVERTQLQALLRSNPAREGAVHVLGDVYLTSSRTLVAGSLAEGSGPSRFRVYLGYAGWAPEQLEQEVESGAWHVLRGEPDLVFDPDPESLWARMIRRTETRFASAAGPRFDPQTRYSSARQFFTAFLISSGAVPSSAARFARGTNSSSGAKRSAMIWRIVSRESNGFPVSR